MEIFYTKKNKIKPNYISPFYNKDFKSEKRRQEFAISRFILDFVFKNFYKLDEYTIEIKNQKPILKEGRIHFSISHSNNIVLLGFEKFPIGVDVEFMKERDFEKISNYFDKKISKKEEFYEFWTRYEAEYKLQTKGINFSTFNLMKDYMVSIASENEFRPINIYEIEGDLCLKKSEL